MKTNMKDFLQHFKPFIIGGASAIFVFLIGFGVMNLYWHFYANNSNLPGLYDYYAATYGDALFLPILVGTGIAYLYSNKYDNRNTYVEEKRISIFVGLLSALLAILIQVSWLLDENINLNWTIPAIHHFNLPGWHHGIFFVFMFYIVGTLIAKIYFKRKKLHPQDRCSLILYSLFWASGMGFVFLHLIDDYSSKWNPVYMLTVSLLILLFVIYLFSYFLSFKQLNRKEFAYIVSFALTVYGFSNIINNGVINNIPAIVVAWIISVVCIDPRETIISVFERYIIIGLPTFILSTAFMSSSSTNMLLLVLTIICPILMSIINRNDLNKTNWRFELCGCIALLIMIIINYFELLLDYGAISTLGGFGTNYVIYAYIVSVFNWVIADENTKTKNTPNFERKRTMKLKGQAYFFIALGAILGIYLVTKEITMLVDNNWHMVKSFNLELFRESIVAIVFGGIILWLCSFKSLKTVFINIVGILCLLIIYIGAACTMLSFIPSNFLKGFYFNYRIIPIALVIICLPSLIVEGFVSNMIIIQVVRCKWFHKVGCVLIYISCIIITYIAFIPIIFKNVFSWYSLFAGIIGVVTGYMVAPYLFSRIIKCERRVHQNKTINGTGSVLQDGFLWAILCSLLIILYGIIVNMDDGKNCVSVLVTVVPSIIWPLNYCLVNNVQHIKQPNKNSLRLYQRNALKRHLQFQNVLAAITTIPFSLIALFFFVMKYALSTKESNLNITEIIIKRFWPK